MSRYTDHDQLAAEALQLCEDVRELCPQIVYQRLTSACMRDPERMAQVLMCLAIWSDLDVPLSALGDRAERVASLPLRMPRVVS